jgi:hypothetical protein
MQIQFIIAQGAPEYAASGIAGFIGIVMILMFIYGVISFLLPIFVYRIMRRGTASYLRLGEMRDLLSGGSAQFVMLFS